MNIKFVLVLGFLSISVFAEEQIVEPEKPSQPEKVSEKEALAEVKAEVNFGDVKKDDENINKEVVENVENTDNGIKASASASASFNFNFKKFLAKWLQDCKPKKENNSEGESNETNVEEENKKPEKNKEAEDSAQNEENPAEDVKSPRIYTYNVHARASASASSSSSASSSFYFNFNDPLEDEESNENENAEIQDENTGAPQENDSVVDDLQENFEENEQSIDVENVEVPEHCNQRNIGDKEPSVDEPIKTEDETQVEEVEQ